MLGSFTAGGFGRAPLAAPAIPVSANNAAAVSNASIQRTRFMIDPPTGGLDQQEARRRGCAHRAPARQRHRADHYR